MPTMSMLSMPKNLAFIQEIGFFDMVFLTPEVLLKLISVLIVLTKIKRQILNHKSYFLDPCRYLILNQKVNDPSDPT